jgi:phosphoglycolate phosphatase-like HAD superfamily hydrolase
MSRIRAVILDIDGTLLDSNDAHARAFVEAARELGIASPGFDAIRKMIGMGGDKLIPAAFGVEAESPEGERLDECKGDIFRRMLPSLRPIEGARALLERFRDEGLRRVVATSAAGEDLKRLLKQADVADLVQGGTSASDVENSKPDPDVIRAALPIAGAGPDQVIMIGDTPYDIEASLRAGVRIVAFRSGGWDDADLHGASEIYDGPADLLERYDRSLFF